MDFKQIKSAIKNDPENRQFTMDGWEPIYTAYSTAKILIIGQAPGRITQETGIPWNDASGENLRKWLKIDRSDFYNKEKFAIIPMDFYFPGASKGGDNPPRKDFARKWHRLILDNMPEIKLTLLIGKYAQEYYLGEKCKETLTETVHSYQVYLPDFFPLVHPSPRNNIWQKKNPWFQEETLPALSGMVRESLKEI